MEAATPTEATSQPPPSAPPSEPPKEPQAQPNGAAPEGNSSTPDWRLSLAGEDTKSIELLSRYKEPGDFLKAHTELRQKLSERPSVARLDDDATPEQIAEYRRALGVSDVSEDADASAYMDAIGVAMPEGYEASELESALVQDFAKQAYDRGYDPRFAKEAVSWFFENQAANQEAVNTQAHELAETWKSELRSELGREYEPTVTVANSFLKQELPDKASQLALLNSMHPDGGRLGDHPAFIKMMAAAAMNSGLGDSIEANSMESGGKSLRDQQHEIESLRTSDPGKYNDQQTQARLDKIIELRLSRGEIDEMGNERKRR